MRTPILLRPGRRRGAALALSAALMPILVGAAAVSIDSGIMATARSQLQTAADSAALAGAMQLYNKLPTGNSLAAADLATAQAQASSFAGKNTIYGHAAVLNLNTSNTNTGTEDIVVGYANNPTYQSLADTTSQKANLATDSASLLHANTVLVRGSNTSGHGTPAPTILGGFLGATGYGTVNVFSAATVQGLVGFQQINSSTNATMLPIVLDQATYDKMVSNATTDQFTFTASNYNPPSSNGVTTGPDGIYESVLYPVSAGDPGNWGTIKVGVSNNSTSILESQIVNGITPAQLATFPGGRIELDQSQTPPSIQFSGNPGISAGLKDALASIIGKPVTIPIYDQTGGNGNNATYRVVEFAWVRLLDVEFQGNPKYVVIQPLDKGERISDQTQIWSTTQQWTSNQPSRIYLSH